MNFSSDNKNIYFRVDFGGLIGRGHLSRCIALAEVFKSKNYNPIFVIRKRPSTENVKLSFETIWLSKTEDVSSVQAENWRVGSPESEAKEMLEVIKADSTVVLDHYALDISFQKIIKEKNHKIILFQDTYNKEFKADVLINYNIGAEKKYQSLGGLQSTVLLLGPQYAPLNLDYSRKHALRFVQNSNISTIGIYLGGVEKEQLKKVASAITKVDYFFDKKIEWVVNSEEERNFLASILTNLKYEIHVRLPGLIDLYERSQLFIGACGVSFLERACIGISQFNFLVADNQKDIAENIISNQLGSTLGDLRFSDEKQIILNLQKALIISSDQNEKMVKSSFLLVDGLGAIRIVNKCVSDWSFRKAELKDSATILNWRNNPEIYRYLFNPAPVELIDHEKWLQQITNKQSVLFLIAEFKGTPAGTVRFDFNDDFKEAEVGIYLAPEMHGKGLSVSMLSESEVVAQKEFSSLKKIIAKVLLENIASKKMFEKAHYKEVAIEKNYIQLEKSLEN